MNTRRTNGLIAGLLFLLTAVVYLPALFCGTVAFDDPSYVANNQHVLSGLSLGDIRWAFEEHNGFWSPLLWISYMVDSSLLSPAPWAFHLTNILLHSLNGMLLCLILMRTTGRRGLSLAAAALWALHPLRVESVAWITERKDVLSGLFFFLALHAYVSFARRGGKGRYIAILLFMSAGLMVKPILITLPALLLLLDAWPLDRFSNGWKKRVIEKIPLFLCAAVFTVTGWLAHRDAISSLETLSLVERAGIALQNYSFYLGKIFWPFGLAAPYPMVTPSLAGSIISFGLLLVVTGVALRLIRRAPFVFVSWFWFCIALFPVCGFIRIGNTTTADRFTYLPTVGLTVALVWGAAALRRVPFKKELALILTAGIMLLSIRQIAFWRDSDALFSRALAVNGTNPVADAFYGGWLTEQGRLDEAEPRLVRAVAQFPAYSPAVNNLGLLFFQRGDWERALICFEAAVANPKHSEQAEVNLQTCRRLMSQ